MDSARCLRRVPLPFPVAPPDGRTRPAVQFIHEDDVGRAFLACIVGAGPPGAYNISGDGVLTGADLVRELGLLPVPIPAAPVQAAARVAAAAAAWPLVPASIEWVEALSHPPIMDTHKAKRDLGWQPRYTSLEALRATLRRTRTS